MDRILFTSLLVGSLALGGCGDDGSSHDQALVDQCVSSSDRAIISAHSNVDGGVGDGGVPDGGGLLEVGLLVEGCVRSFCISELFADDEEALSLCVNTCVDGTEVSGLSDGCRECFLQEISCGTEFCVLDCTGSNEALCHACVAEFCAPEHTACVGF